MSQLSEQLVEDHWISLFRPSILQSDSEESVADEADLGEVAQDIETEVTSVLNQEDADNIRNLTGNTDFLRKRLTMGLPGLAGLYPVQDLDSIDGSPYNTTLFIAKERLAEMIRQINYSYLQLSSTARYRNSQSASPILEGPKKMDTGEKHDQLVAKLTKLLPAGLALDDRIFHYDGTEKAKRLTLQTCDFLAHYYESVDYSDQHGEPRRYIHRFNGFRIKGADQCQLLPLNGTRPFDALMPLVAALLPEEIIDLIEVSSLTDYQGKFSGLKNRLGLQDAQVVSLEKQFSGRRLSAADIDTLRGFYLKLLRHYPTLSARYLSTNTHVLFVGDCDVQSANIISEAREMDHFHIVDCNQSAEEDALKQAAISILFDGETSHLSTSGIEYASRVSTQTSLSPEAASKELHEILTGYDEILEEVNLDSQRSFSHVTSPDYVGPLGQAPTQTDDDYIDQLMRWGIIRHNPGSEVPHQRLKIDAQIKLFKARGHIIGVEQREFIYGPDLKDPDEGRDFIGLAELTGLDPSYLSGKIFLPDAVDADEEQWIRSAYLDRIGGGLDEYIWNPDGSSELTQATQGRPAIALYEIDKDHRSHSFRPFLKDLLKRLYPVAYPDYQVQTLIDRGIGEAFGMSRDELASLTYLLERDRPYSTAHYEVLMKIIRNYDQLALTLPIPKKAVFLKDEFDSSCPLTARVVSELKDRSASGGVHLVLSVHPSAEQIKAVEVETAFKEFYPCLVEEIKMRNIRETSQHEERLEKLDLARQKLLNTLLEFIDVSSPAFAEEILRKLYDNYSHILERIYARAGQEASLDLYLDAQAGIKDKTKVQNGVTAQFLGIIAKASLVQGKKAMFMRQKKHAIWGYQMTHRFKTLVHHWYAHDPQDRPTEIVSSLRTRKYWELKGSHPEEEIPALMKEWERSLPREQQQLLSERDYYMRSHAHLPETPKYLMSESGSDFPFSLACLSDEMFEFMVAFNCVGGNIRKLSTYKECPVLNLRDFALDHIAAAGIPQGKRLTHPLYRFMNAMSEYPYTGIHSDSGEIINPRVGIDTMEALMELLPDKRPSTPLERYLVDWKAGMDKEALFQTHSGIRRAHYAPMNIDLDNFVIPYLVLLGYEVVHANPVFRDEKHLKSLRLASKRLPETGMGVAMAGYYNGVNEGMLALKTGNYVEGIRLFTEAVDALAPFEEDSVHLLRNRAKNGVDTCLGMLIDQSIVGIMKELENPVDETSHGADTDFGRNINRCFHQIYEGLDAVKKALKNTNSLEISSSRLEIVLTYLNYVLRLEYLTIMLTRAGLKASSYMPERSELPVELNTILDYADQRTGLDLKDSLYLTASKIIREGDFGWGIEEMQKAINNRLALTPERLRDVHFKSSENTPFDVIEPNQHLLAKFDELSRQMSEPDDDDFSFLFKDD